MHLLHAVEVQRETVDVDGSFRDDVHASREALTRNRVVLMRAHDHLGRAHGTTQMFQGAPCAAPCAHFGRRPERALCAAWAAMAALFAGLDVGTQSTKCVLYDAETKAVAARAARAHAPVAAAASGRAEQDPVEWIEAATHAFRAALSLAGEGAAARVRGSGVSGQQHGLVALDDDRAVVRLSLLPTVPRYWRTANYCHTFTGRIVR